MKTVHTDVEKSITRRTESNWNINEVRTLEADFITTNISKHARLTNPVRVTSALGGNWEVLKDVSTPIEKHNTGSKAEHEPYATIECEFFYAMIMQIVLLLIQEAYFKYENLDLWKKDFTSTLLCL